MSAIKRIWFGLSDTGRFIVAFLSGWNLAMVCALIDRAIA